MIYPNSEDDTSQEQLISPFYSIGIMMICMGIIDVILAYLSHDLFFEYSSKFHIIAIVAGIILVQNRQKWIRLVIFFCAFFSIVCFLEPFFEPFLMPFPLFKLYVSKITWSEEMDKLIHILQALIFFLFYTAITSQMKTLSANEEEMDLYKKPKVGFWIGFIFTALIVTNYAFYLQQSVSKKTVSILQQRYGTQYQYWISAIKEKKFNQNTLSVADVFIYNNRSFIKTTVPLPSELIDHIY